MLVSEFSSGGVVLDLNKVLIVKVQTLRKKKVWTFPKGHIEPGENPQQTALREVLEETGYRCRIIKPLLRVRYCFTFKGDFVRKAVQWYLMTKLAKAGRPDAAEILDTKWISLHKAKQLLQYPSDKKLIDLVGIIPGSAPTSAAGTSELA